ncbi:hypothetical protein [Methylobacterium iners]|uniref:Uncharacterized protein n=1 Tax=Methylobacterium iners TaxID=418707 RepID=A0ABQ4RQ64_9HYPH|nr:hypothetical protein [Methylobacterium iners]GJD92889.1 hypothetical protein OCOJLMKI_0072 [Methylobacterium iners]
MPFSRHSRRGAWKLPLPEGPPTTARILPTQSPAIMRAIAAVQANAERYAAERLAVREAFGITEPVPFEGRYGRVA